MTDSKIGNFGDDGEFELGLDLAIAIDLGFSHGALGRAPGAISGFPLDIKLFRT